MYRICPLLLVESKKEFWHHFYLNPIDFGWEDVHSLTKLASNGIHRARLSFFEGRIQDGFRNIEERACLMIPNLNTNSWEFIGYIVKGDNGGTTHLYISDEFLEMATKIMELFHISVDCYEQIVLYVLDKPIVFLCENNNNHG